MTRVASIGECMIELSAAAGGLLARAWGGDTLNTAVYLARLGVGVDYVTALGDDPWSEEMLRAWEAEGVGTERVVRVTGRLPGLYLISTDAGGQRRFDYWRDSAPARLLFDLPQTRDDRGGAGRLRRDLPVGRLAVALRRGRPRAAVRGARRGAGQRRARRLRHQLPRRAAGRTGRWAGRPFAQPCAAPTSCSPPPRTWTSCSARAASRELPTADGRIEVVLKLAEPAVRIFHRGSDETIAAEPVGGVVDTTAAGDSFAAAYLAARLAGAEPAAAARHGHTLAGAVVQHRGAIIPRAAMPEGCRVAEPQGKADAMSDSRSDMAQARRAKLDAILRASPIIPVITIERAEDGVPLARALVARRPAGAGDHACARRQHPTAARAIASQVPEAILGVGTVLTPEDLEAARRPGRALRREPGRDARAARRGGASDLPLLPGVQTASELMAALARGFDVVKLFPGGAGGRDSRAQGAGRAVPAGALLPDRRHRRGQLRPMAGAAQRGGRRRLVAGARSRHPRRQLGRHHRARAAGGGEAACARR